MPPCRKSAPLWRPRGGSLALIIRLQHSSSARWPQKPARAAHLRASGTLAIAAASDLPPVLLPTASSLVRFVQPSSKSAQQRLAPLLRLVRADLLDLRFAHFMTYSAVATFGMIGWLLLIVRSTIRGCRAGHAPLALLSFFILFSITVEVWAIAPSQLELKFSRGLTLLLLWPAALFPYLAFVLRFSRRKTGGVPGFQS